MGLYVVYIKFVNQIAGIDVNILRVKILIKLQNQSIKAIIIKIIKIT